MVSKTGKQKTFGEADENKWELYDLKNDPTERNNLATKYPDKTKEMAQKWETEALKTKAKPWPWKPAK